MYNLLELYSQMPETKTVSRQSITPIIDSQGGGGGGGVTGGGGGGSGGGGGGGGILLKTGRKFVRDLELGDIVSGSHHHQQEQVEAIPMQAFEQSNPQPATPTTLTPGSLVQGQTQPQVLQKL